MSDQYPQSPYQSQGNHGGLPTNPYAPTPPRNEEGESASKLSMILGIISIFFAGLILGPLAIYQANKAEKLGAEATIGKVTGWIGTILAALWFLGFMFFFIVGISAGAAGY